jgi:hypothetical protein
MRYLNFLIVVYVITLFLVGCKYETPVSSEPVGPTGYLDNYGVESVEVKAFQAAGDYGGGVLDPGTFFPPTKRTYSNLRRGGDRVKYNLHTTDLPPGAYTNRLVVINNPEECDGDCDEADVFENPSTNSSVFWTTGGIVQDDGIGNFYATSKIGDKSKEPDQHIFGPGLVNPERAEVWIIIKYHGPVSDEPDELYLQTNTLTSLSEEGANAYDLGDEGIQGFDPQIAIHKRKDL